MRASKLLVLIGLALIAGCADYGDDPADGGGPTDPPGAPETTVSFADDVQPIFDTNCVGCHGDGGNAGLDLRSGPSYTNLVQIPATESALNRVERDEPLQSWLYLKMTGQQNVGTEMPPGGPLDATVTDVVRTWIEEGAQDN
jgi:mono/diheme cytochrome c family protein